MTDDLGLDEIHASLASHKRHIKSVEHEIKGLKRHKRKYQQLISDGGGGYDVAALNESCDHTDLQIDRMQQLISVAITQIADCRRQIKFIETRAAIAKGAVIDAGDAKPDYAR